METPSSNVSLYVGDLQPEVTEAQLHEVFSAIGTVASIRVCRDAVTRRSLGYAYVNYHNGADAERALDTLNFSSIRGAPCRIMWSYRDPQLRKSGSGNVFVKNLDKTVDNKALYDTFSLFGNILSCKVAVDHENKSRGFGFVHYETDEAAKLAIEKVNGMEIGSKTVYVGPFVRRNDRTSGKDEKFTNIYIKDFPPTWTDDTLSTLFSGYGKITSCALTKDKKGRPFAFVNFEDSDAAHLAVTNLHGKVCTNDGVKGEDEVHEEKEKEEDKWEDSGDKKEKEDGEKKDDEKKEKTEEDGESSTPEVNKLYVGRAMTKAERQAVLRGQHDEVEKAKETAFQGVNLYVKNLADTVDDDKLRELFEPFGTITSAKVMRDEKDVSKGFGFVCFVSPDEATKAVTEMHLKLHHSKPLYVGLAEKKDQRLARLQQRYRPPQARPAPNQMMNSVPGMGFMGGPTGMAGGFGGPGMGGPGGMVRPNMMFGGPMMQQGGFPMRGPAGRGFAGPQGMGPQGGMGPMGQMPGMVRPGMPGMMGGMGMGGMGGMGMAGMGGMGGMGMGMGGMAGMGMGGMPMMGQMGPMAGPMGAAVRPGGRGRGGMMGGPAQMMGQAGPMMMNMNMMGMQGPRPMGMGQQQGARLTKQNQHQQQGPGYQFTQQARNKQTEAQPSQPVQKEAPVQQPAAQSAGSDLTAAALAQADPMTQKQMLGERLFVKIAVVEPKLAGKITGMMLDMEISELLILLESETQLRAKVEEALRVLKQAGMEGTAAAEASAIEA